MKQLPNVVVLDGKVRTFARLRSWAPTTPAFTPEKSVHHH